MYYNKLPGGEYIYLLLYVDDMLIASKSRSAIDKLKKDLSFEFEMKDLGEAKIVLGMEIERDRRSGKFSLTQKGYLQKVLQRFNINGDTKFVSTPLAPHLKLKVTMSSTITEERECMTHVLYANIVGSLIYAMVCTKSDLSQIVSMINRYMHDPGKGHWEQVKWVLRCAKGTIDVSLVFEKDSTSKYECIGYVDSDYARDLDKCRSTTGCVYIISSTVSWRSILQSTVALSITEAEYMAMTEAMKEAIWLQRLLDDLRIDQDLLKINCDSMSAIYLAKNLVYHARMKCWPKGLPP